MLLDSYVPKHIQAGDYPVVTESGTVAALETVLELMPICLDVDGNIKAVTAETIADVYGLAATDADESGNVIYYLTGEFFEDSIVIPNGTTTDAFKSTFRKLGIFLKKL